MSLSNSIFWTYLLPSFNLCERKTKWRKRNLCNAIGNVRTGAGGGKNAFFWKAPRRWSLRLTHEQLKSVCQNLCHVLYPGHPSVRAAKWTPNPATPIVREHTRKDNKIWNRTQHNSYAMDKSHTTKSHPSARQPQQKLIFWKCKKFWRLKRQLMLHFKNINFPVGLFVYVFDIAKTQRTTGMSADRIQTMHRPLMPQHRHMPIFNLNT